MKKNIGCIQRLMNIFKKSNTRRYVPRPFICSINRMCITCSNRRRKLCDDYHVYNSIRFINICLRYYFPNYSDLLLRNIYNIGSVASNVICEIISNIFTSMYWIMFMFILKHGYYRNPLCMTTILRCPATRIGKSWRT